MNGKGKDVGRKIAVLRKNAKRVGQMSTPLRALPVAGENAHPQVFVVSPAAASRIFDVVRISESADYPAVHH